MAPQPSATETILNRVYFVFFVIHIPIILFVDLVRFYPEGTAPEFSLQIQEFYVETFRDKFFSDEAPAWFTGFLVLEAVYHLPISVWMLNAILEGHPWLALNLLIFGVQTALTTFTAILEMLSWPDYTTGEQLRLCSLYCPYLALAVVMGVDAFFRLARLIDAKPKTS